MYCLGYFYYANWKMKGFNLKIASQEGFRICDHQGIRYTGIEQCLRDYMQIHSQEKIDVKSGDWEGKNFWDFKSCPQCHTSSNKASLPNPCQIVPPTGDQTLSGYWSPSHWNQHSFKNKIEDSFLCIRSGNLLILLFTNYILVSLLSFLHTFIIWHFLNQSLLDSPLFFKFTFVRT